MPHPAIYRCCEFGKPNEQPTAYGAVAYLFLGRDNLGRGCSDGSGDTPEN
jgi:hypothetical protein